MIDAISLGLFASRIEAVCDEMGAVLRRTAFSPNIKDRLDFSCAVFDAGGELCAQAAHIPVHLGSMAFAMADVVGGLEWAPGDMVVMNDPFLGGTHLPDVTVIAPVFAGERLLAFVVNRAHHANIGADTPGSMPISTRLEQEGVIIAPSYLYRAGVKDKQIWRQLCGGAGEDASGAGDFAAQVSANRAGVARLSELIEKTSIGDYLSALSALNDYAERLAREALRKIPSGTYSFVDVMDGDGINATDVKIQLALSVDSEGVSLDFTGTHAQVGGNINCPLPVTAAAAFYVFRCLMPPQTPACAGSFRPIRIVAANRSLVNAERPAAVAAGNVETSSRIVDVILGALAQAVPDLIPAASQGTMNNLAMGHAGFQQESEEQERGQQKRDQQKSQSRWDCSRWDGSRWDYYETIAGGTGASARGPGLAAVQSHMTNTLNTPVESLETHYPLRVTRYSLRRGSGGGGKYAGGDGLEREFEFLAPAEVTLLTERRSQSPWGLAGGEAGKPGENRLNGELVAGKCQLSLEPGDRLLVSTPGGGGWGKDSRESPVSRKRGACR